MSCCLWLCGLGIRALVEGLAGSGSLVGSHHLRLPGFMTGLPTPTSQRTPRRALDHFRLGELVGLLGGEALEAVVHVGFDQVHRVVHFVSPWGVSPLSL